MCGFDLKRRLRIGKHSTRTSSNGQTNGHYDGSPVVGISQGRLPGQPNQLTPGPPSKESTLEPSTQSQTEQPSSEREIEKLKNDVDKVLVLDCYSNLKFIPANEIARIATRQNVHSVLKAQGHTDAEAITNWVMEGAQRLFIILIKMTGSGKKLVGHLEKCKIESFQDESLPVKLSELGGVAAEKADNSKTFEFFTSWGENERILFETHQWTVMAPIFSHVAPFYSNFHNSRRLPCLSRKSKPAGAGYFGEVIQVEMHRDHVPDLPQLDPTTRGVSVAIKKAKNGEELAEFFDKEVENLLKIRDYEQTHVVKPIAAYKIHDDRFLVFPWAAGGNLDAYWRKHKDLRHDSERLKWLFDQMAGLFAALRYIHHVREGRHGDLKPDNILCFIDRDGKETLQIGDLGLTTFHDKNNDTVERDEQLQRTNTPIGHRRYAPPPRPATIQRQARSRGYDVWSMGCILIELLIYLTSGYDAVLEYREQTPNVWEENEKRGYRLHPDVLDTMGTMEAGLEENTAYKDLFRLAKDRMLVVDLPIRYGISTPGCRDCAKVVSEEMDRIKAECASKEYLRPVSLEYPHFKKRTKNEVSTSSRLSTDNTLQLSNARSSTGPSVSDNSPPPQIRVQSATVDFNSNSLSTGLSRESDKRENQSSKLDDTWNAYADNTFALDFINLAGWQNIGPKKCQATLCEGCSINPPSSLDGEQDLEITTASSKRCDLCAMVLQALARVGMSTHGTVNLRNNGATVAVAGGPSLLSLYPEPAEYLDEDEQLGLPRLLDTKSVAQYSLISKWIRECDKSHKMCRRPDGIGIPVMPTRVIDLGQPLRLVESATIPAAHYAALSHRWGILTEAQKFCTYKRNIESMKTSIDISHLPRSFRDAVTVAREAGVKYLWIDSICIIQDNGDDWKAEAGRMEQVFSGAYFTIGATAASSSLDGFLHDRAERPCVTLPRGRDEGDALYVCPAIDDFHRDVELAELNQRGWVLQERALSRRSVHFTSTQMYWECGRGVHCETLARLDNAKAAFIGDANFPKSALEYYRDGRQVLVQDLYERYSGLAFTNPEDRAVAILGLQKRLARAFNTRAAYGFLAAYFTRGLLWQRRGGSDSGSISDGEEGSNSDLASSAYMMSIPWKSGSSSTPPSWSWLSKSGPIRYMVAKYDQIAWATTTDFTHPFISHPKEDGPGEDLSVIRGLARQANLSRDELLSLVDFDTEPVSDVRQLRFVIIGRDKVESQAMMTAKQYVLVVQLAGDGTTGTHERVGVGSLWMRHMDEGVWVTIR